ncbi:MAG: hypothetical protein CMF50_00400 [Legionellales bacterium]|nr:hypothetical protein [Legionellales bacterium]|tara:strand:- start:47465 stop:48691 length:1227 start_codon:yes stop_codon:yes gene_type:complete
MLKRTITIIVLLAILAGAGYSIKHFLFSEQKETKQGQMPPTVVQTFTAQQQKWLDQITATGTMSAFKGIIVKPEVSGRITKIYFEDGTYVKKGDPLVQIYPDILQAQLKQNEAALELAKLDFERGDELYAKRVISRQEYDNLSSTLQQRQADVEATKAQLEQHNITADFSGMVGLRQVNLGAHVSAGEAIVSLQELDPIRVQFTVPETFLNELALGQVVEISPSSEPNKTYKGIVYAFDSAINPKTRSLSVRAKVPNPQHKLLPGLFVDLTLYAGTPHDVVVVPQTAIDYSTQGNSVYKVIDGKAQKANVKTGLRRGNLIEVTDGLKAGDLVVIAGQLKLTNGAPVILAKSQQPGSSAADVDEASDADKQGDNSAPNGKVDAQQQASTPPASTNGVNKPDTNNNNNGN